MLELLLLERVEDHRVAGRHHGENALLEALARQAFFGLIQPDECVAATLLRRSPTIGVRATVVGALCA